MKEKSFIHVLGTAQDGGYPQIGCDCPNCQAAEKDPSLRRLPSSLGLIDNTMQRTFIVDATPALPQQLKSLNDKALRLGFPKDHLSGILLTHAHLGHYTGLMYLGKEALNTRNLKVYCTRAMVQFLSHNAPWSDLIKNNNITLVPFKSGSTFKLSGSLSIEAIEVPHRNEHADTVGFLIKGESRSAFYLPDFDTWKGFFNTFNRITNEVNYIFLDGTFFDQEELGEFRSRSFKDVPHPPISTSIKRFNEGVLKKNISNIYFTHFNHTNRVLNLDHPNSEYVKDAGFNLLSEGAGFEL